MFLIAHAAAGAALASSVDSPPAAFIIGWLSHYLVDLIPHGDEAVGEWTKKGNEVRRFGLVAGIDGLLLAGVLVWLFLGRGGVEWNVLAAAVGATVPDVMWGIEKVAGRTLFGAHRRFHHRIHNYFHVRMPTWLGLSFQAAFAALLWYWLFVR